VLFGGEFGGVLGGVAGVVDAGDLGGAVDGVAGGGADVGGGGGDGVVDVVGVGDPVDVGVGGVGGEGGGQELHGADGLLPGAGEPPPARPVADGQGGGVVVAVERRPEHPGDGLAGGGVDVAGAVAAVVGLDTADRREECPVEAIAASGGGLVGLGDAGGHARGGDDGGPWGGGGAD
jgi:hypothetical protein